MVRFITISTLAGVAFSLVGEASGRESKPEVSLTMAYSSLYVDAGSEIAGASLQPGMEFHSEALSGGVWLNLPVDDERGTISDEYQFYAGHQWRLSETLTFGAGATVYAFPQSSEEPEETLEANLSLGYEGDLALALLYDYDIVLQQHQFTLVTEYAIPLNEEMAIVPSGAVGWVTTGDTNGRAPGSPADGYVYFEAVADFVWEATENLSFTAGPFLAANNNGDANIAGREAWLGWRVSATATF